MKTFVILSDTHRNIKPLEKIATVLAECDYIIHLGDMAGDARELMRAYPEKTYVIAGNNDFWGGESEIVLDAEGRRIFACHGHRYGVKGSRRARGGGGVGHQPRLHDAVFPAQDVLLPRNRGQKGGCDHRRFVKYFFIKPREGRFP